MATPTRLDLSYRTAIQRVRARVEAFAQAAFIAGQFRDADVERFVAQVVPVVLAGQRTISSLTDAWLAMTLSQQLGREVRPGGALTDLAALRGVDPAEVYTRPYKSVWNALAVGVRYREAVEIGKKRLTDVSLTDMQLAKTHTLRAGMARVTEITHYQRVLVGAKNCALCYIASTQRYTKADLLPIHPGCDCAVAPIVGTFDQKAELEAAHEAIADRFGDAAVSRGGRDPLDYRKAILVRQHGEIGPVLTLREHRFTGAADVA